MLRKEKSKKKFRKLSEETDFRPKRKKNTPKQKYKHRQIWLAEDEEIDRNWREEDRSFQSE